MALYEKAVPQNTQRKPQNIQWKKPLHSLLPKTIGTAVHFNRKEPQTKKPLRSLRYLDRLTSAMLSTSQYIALR